MLPLLPAQVERLAGVRVYSTVFLGVGRVLFEVAPDYVKKYKLYVDVLRIWAVTLTGAHPGGCGVTLYQWTCCLVVVVAD